MTRYLLSFGTKTLFAMLANSIAMLAKGIATPKTLFAMLAKGIATLKTLFATLAKGIATPKTLFAMLAKGIATPKTPFAMLAKVVFGKKLIAHRAALFCYAHSPPMQAAA